MATKKITVKMLEDMKACKDQMNRFKQFCKDCNYPDGVEVNLDNFKKAEKYGLDVMWAIYKELIPVDFIIDLNIPKYAFYCLRYVKGLSEEQYNKLVNIIIENGDKYYIYSGLKCIKGLSEKQKKALQITLNKKVPL